MKLKDKDLVDANHLRDLPEVQEQKPPATGYCMASTFQRYSGTDCYQWYANTHAGSWVPYGEILVGLKGK